MRTLADCEYPLLWDANMDPNGTVLYTYLTHEEYYALEELEEEEGLEAYKRAHTELMLRVGQTNVRADLDPLLDTLLIEEQQDWFLCPHCGCWDGWENGGADKHPEACSVCWCELTDKKPVDRAA